MVVLESGRMAVQPAVESDDGAGQHREKEPKRNVLPSGIKRHGLSLKIQPAPRAADVHIEAPAPQVFDRFDAPVSKPEARSSSKRSRLGTFRPHPT